MLLLVDRIDLATARAIQYARSLTPDELYAVHFNSDSRRAEALMRRWRDLVVVRCGRVWAQAHSQDFRDTRGDCPAAGR